MVARHLIKVLEFLLLCFRITLRSKTRVLSQKFSAIGVVTCKNGQLIVQRPRGWHLSRQLSMAVWGLYDTQVKVW